jgi:hypothetical protein
LEPPPAGKCKEDVRFRGKPASSIPHRVVEVEVADDYLGARRVFASEALEGTCPRWLARGDRRVIDHIVTP